MKIQYLNMWFKVLVVIVYLFLTPQLLLAASFPERVGTWENITSFTISPAEDYMVMSITIIGRNQLYESYLKEGIWTEPNPLETINVHFGQGFEIAGPFLSFDGRKLYYHANFPDTKGGLDIYFSEKTAKGWSAPKNIGEPINTSTNELFPSIDAGEERMFFTREITATDIRKPKESPNCQAIYMALKNPLGKWDAPTVLHEQINRGCEHAARIAIDGRTLYFSAVETANAKEGFNLYFTQEILKDSWLLPMKIDLGIDEDSRILPQLTKGNLYFLKRSVVKKIPVGSIFRVQLDENQMPKKTIVSRGKIIDLASKQPIEAELTVFDPTTLAVIGKFSSDKLSGEFEIPLLDGQNYIVDIRKQGFSFASFQLDYRKEDEKITNPETIELFQKIELVLAVYDNEIFRPLEARVYAENPTQKGKKFEGIPLAPGIFSFSIPMGQQYIITAEADKFEPNSFDFNLTGDIIFAKFERNLPLVPRKKAFDIVISDKDTEEGVMAEVVITNLNREETIFFSAKDVKDGKITAMLREGDQYEFTIRGAQGYSFHNQIVDLGKQETSELKAELVSLKAKTTIRLNNINFGSNSAELTTESFPELNRVVQLLKDNPAIVIEIGAHTDNVGSDRYNLTLSEKRAQSVVNYLLDNAIPTDRIVSKGYGMKKPMVPNTTDENRALNRRVEFNILEVREDGTYSAESN